MKEFFVIGNQTSSSLSPLIFNHWFKKYKIKAKYSYVEVDDIGFDTAIAKKLENKNICLLYTSPSPRDVEESRMPSSA